MRLFSIRTNIKPLQKICLTGLFIALTSLLQKVLAVNNVPSFPFFRLSFGGPALIIFSSILLGPIYGFTVGAGSDLLGYLIFDIKAFPLFPQLTLVYGLLGLLSYFVFNLIKKIKKKNTIIAIMNTFLLVIYVLTFVFILLNGSIDLPVKIFFLISLTILFAFLITFVFIYDLKMKPVIGINIFHISFACFILELVIIVVFGSLMKATAFGFDLFPMIFISQSAILFFNVCVDAVIISILLKVTKKYFIEK